MKRSVLIVLAVAILGLIPALAEARITRIEIAVVESPTFEGRSFGAVGQYERLKGIAHGEVDPNHGLNADIVLLDRAPRNARGLVEYSVDVDILRPVDPSRGRGDIYYDVNNRGNKVAIGFVNEGGVVEGAAPIP